MRKVFMLAACAALLALPAAGQSPGRLTFGGQFFTLFTYQAASSPTATFGPLCRCAYYGGGVTFTARLVKRLGLSASLNFLPSRGAPDYNFGLTELSIGPRLRLASNRRWAFFVALRPAWGWQSGSVSITSPLPGGGTTASSSSFTNGFFGLEIGGALQARITRRWLWRLSAGDLWVHQSDIVATNNPQVSLGIAYRF